MSTDLQNQLRSLKDELLKQEGVLCRAQRDIKAAVGQIKTTVQQIDAVLNN